MSDEGGVDKTSKFKKISGFLVKLLPFLTVAVAASVVSFYFIKLKPEALGLTRSVQSIQNESNRLLAEIGKLISLPTDEKPTIATVTDPEKVKSQVFFKDAKVGDKVLIFQKAQKAILYRPSEKRIIEVGAVSINKTQ